MAEMLAAERWPGAAISVPSGLCNLRAPQGRDDSGPPPLQTARPVRTRPGKRTTRTASCLSAIREGRQQPLRATDDFAPGWTPGVTWTSVSPV